MGRYGGYGGYVNPSQMQQMWGSPPGYNPYQQNMQWGMGISQMIQQLMATLQAKKQGQQEALGQERAQADRDTQMWLQLQQNRRAEEAQKFNMERASKPKRYEWEDNVEALTKQGIPTREAYQQVFNIKTPEDLNARLDRLHKEEEAKAKGKAEGTPPKTTGLTPAQKKTQETTIRGQVLTSVNGSLKEIADTFKTAAESEMSGKGIPLDYGSLKKSRETLRKYQAKLLSGNNLSKSEMAEFSRISTDPSSAFPATPIKDVGGAMGQKLGSDIKPSQKDKYGYAIGESRLVKGATWEYIGNNQWRKKS